MNIPAYYILVGVLIGWACTLSSGALIGYMIFKTKREAHESLFPGKEKPGQVFNIEEDWEKEIPEGVAPEVPDAIRKAGAQFREQMPTPKIAETLGKEDES